MESFTLKLKEMHPGVVDMDARYDFYCEFGDRTFPNAADPKFLLFVDEPGVKVNGAQVIVPYAVRKAGKPVRVRAVLNADYVDLCFNNENDETRPAFDASAPLPEAEYTLQFSTAFSDEPTLFDDFETLDRTVWRGGEDGWEYKGAGSGFVEDGDLVLRVTEEDPSMKIETTAHSFQQTFGCFSASIRFPGYTQSPDTSNCAFWLCSNVFHPEEIFFLRNPAGPEGNGRQHAGEIDIIEYSPAWGDYGSSTTHWFGWSPAYHRQAGMGEMPTPNIREGYHTISLVWEPGVLYWYYDGGLARVYRGEGIEGVGDQPGAEMVVLFDIARRTDGKGTWCGKPFPQDLPLEMRVDWVKVHALKR